MRPLDPTAGPAQSFAAELRELRREAGEPSFAEMARRVHWGVSALATAARGERLPTWDVTEGFVRALDGDVAVWRRRWEAAHRRAHGLAAEPGDAAVDLPAGHTATLARARSAGAVAVEAPVAVVASVEAVQAVASVPAVPAVAPVAVDSPAGPAGPAGPPPSPLAAAGPRRRLLVVALVVSLALAATAIVIGRSTGGKPSDPRVSSAEAARQADLIRTGNPALALRLGLAAYALAPTADARGALWNSSAAAFPTPLPGGLGAPLDSVSSSRDGRTVVAAGAAVARIWTVSDPGHPTLASELRLGAHAPAILSPAGPLLAAAGPDRTVDLYDVSDPGRPRRVRALVTDVDTVASMAFSPDGHTLAVAVDRDRAIELFDVSDPSRPVAEGVLGGDATAYSIVAFSRDGGTVAAADGAGRVELWAVDDRRRPRRMAVLPARGKVTALAFSPASAVLVVAGERTCELWDTTDPAHPVTRQQWNVLTGQADLDVLTALTFSPDGRYLFLAAADGTITLANAGDGRPYATFNDDAPVRGLSANEAGYGLIDGVAGGDLHLWHPLLPATVTNRPSPPTVTVFSDSGRLMAGIGNDGGVSLWRTEDPSQPAIVATLPGPTHGAFFTPDDKALIALGVNGGATLWSVTDPGHPVQRATISGLAGPYLPGSMTMIPGTHTLAMSTPDGQVAFWDITDPGQPHRLETVPAGPPGSQATVTASPRRRMVAVSLPGPRLTIQLVNVTDSRQPVVRATLTDPAAHPADPPRVTISPDGRVLAVTDSANLVHLWNIADPSQPSVERTLSRAAIPGALAFAPDSDLLAVGGPDSAVHLWDVRDAARPADLIGLPAGFAAEHLAFSPDGRLLAGGGENGTVLLWDTTQPRRVTPAGRITFSNSMAQLPAVTTMSFAPRGGLLSVILAGQTQFIVDLDVHRLYQRLCALPNSRISRAEWNQYLPGVPYRPPC